MKLKRTLAIISTMAMMLFVGCDKTSESSSVTTVDETTSAKITTTAQVSDTAEVTDEEHVLRILANNDYLQNLVQSCIDEYVVIDEYTGQIGDMKIVWQIGPANADWDYNGVVKHEIETQSEATAYDKIDIIIADGDQLPAYVENSYVMPLADIGITSEDTAEMYPYTLTSGTFDGQLTSLAFDVTPVVFAYRRDIAKDVLGSDDPETVARYVADIEALTSAAQLMKESGYHVLSTADDLYYAYKSDISPAALSDDGVQLDYDISLWAERAREYADNDYITDSSMWMDEWAEGMTMEGDVFGYILPTWGVFWTLPAQAGDAGNGNYAVCTPPSYTHWGGTYICTAKGTDDPEPVAEFLRLLFSKETSIALATGEQKLLANHMSAMDELAASSDGEAFLGGQNALALFIECAKLIDEPSQTSFGVSSSQCFRASMRDYILGKTTYEEAFAKFMESAEKINVK